MSTLGNTSRSGSKRSQEGQEDVRDREVDSGGEEEVRDREVHSGGEEEVRDREEEKSREELDR